MITSDSKYSSIPHSQIILLGNEKKEELFATMQRNILERWLIRYENLNVEETLNESNQFQVKLTESNEKAHFLSIGLGPTLIFIVKILIVSKSLVCLTNPTNSS